jgi:hypothetical protein
MHVASISPRLEGVAATSAETTALQNGSRAEFPIIVADHRSNGEIPAPAESRIALAPSALL